MTIHAREPFSSGKRFELRTRCGAEYQDGDVVVDAIVLANRAAITCERCVAVLAREDERAPMGESGL